MKPHKNTDHSTPPHMPDAARHAHDRGVFHALLRAHADINREVEHLPDGIRTVTRSDDIKLVRLLHDHVSSMHDRLLTHTPLRRWDPLYAELFAHRDQITMDIRLIPDGVMVTERSDDPWVARLIQAHGETVSAFVRDGFKAAQRPSPLPAH